MSLVRSMGKRMPNLGTLCVALVVASLLAVDVALAHGTVDQAEVGEYMRGIVIWAAAPVGQEFTPTQADVSGVDFALCGTNTHIGPGQDITVTIRQGSITGPILGSSTQFISSAAPCDFYHFDFDPAVAVTPGDLYVAQLTAPPFLTEFGDLGGIMTEVQGSSNGPGDPSQYLGGRAIENGVPLDWSDQRFRTYSGAESNQAPDCALAAPSVASIWPANHQMVAVSVLGVSDPDGDAVSLEITGVRQDEPVDGVADGAGVGSDTAQVRAERAGKGDGRMYRIAFTASDGADACSSEVLVGVPHDQGRRSAVIDGGPLYDSTAA